MRRQPLNRKVWTETFFRPWPGFSVGAVVLLAGSFLYVWLRVEPLLEYHHHGPYFFRQRVFWEPFLHRPGGLASYAGVFLAQSNCLNGLGTSVFVLSECGVLLAAVICLARIIGRAPGFVALAPLFLLLLLRNRFGCPVLTMSVGLLMALAAFAALVWLPWRRPWWLTAMSGLFSGLLCWAAGPWSALLFSILCGLFLIIQMRNWPAGLGCLLLALAALLLTIGVGRLEIAGLVNPWPSRRDGALAAALYASVPITGAVLALLQKLAATSSAPRTGRFSLRMNLRSDSRPEASSPQPSLPKEASEKPPATLEFGRAKSEVPPGGILSPQLAQPAVVLAFLIGWAAVWLTFDEGQKLLAEIDYDAGCGKYQAALAAAQRVKALDDPAKIRLQLALYHTGRLAEELFSFRSLVEEPPAGGLGEGCRAQSQPLFELGLVNDAEHMACEALVLEGDRPDLLRLLASINRLKGRPQAAQVFLNVLSLIPFQGERADDTWPAMAPGMPAAERPFPSRMLAPALTNDVLHEGLQVGRLLDVLLASNPTNQMAFEYAMAGYLLDLDLKQVVDHLWLLDNFNYPRVPRPYEEALLLYQQLAKVQLEWKGRAIRPETTERFRQFKEAVKHYKASPEDLAVMAAHFGDTYWYYYYTVLGRERAAEVQSAAP